MEENVKKEYIYSLWYIAKSIHSLLNIYMCVCICIYILCVHHFAVHLKLTHFILFIFFNTF